jgi:pyruvate-formate lyase-activating enzyme
MLSLSLQDLEVLTRPICSPELFRRKVENYHRVAQSFTEKQEICAGLPVEMNLEPSGICNMHCSGCPRGRGRIKRSGLLAYETFQQALEPLADSLCNIFISGFGEPLINPHLPRMIALARGYGIATVMNTNGTYLRQQADGLLDAQLTLINVALDGAVSESYHEYHPGAPFSRTVEGVEYLRQRRDQRGLRSPIIEGQFILREYALGEIDRLKRWAEAIGVERVKFKRPYLTLPDEEDRPAVESVSDYLKQLGLDHVISTEITTWTPADCALPWDNLLLACTGQVGICCYDPHLHLALADSVELCDTAQLWNGERIREVRRWLAGIENQPVNPCAHCNRMPGYLVPQ